MLTPRGALFPALKESADGLERCRIRFIITLIIG